MLGGFIFKEMFPRTVFRGGKLYEFEGMLGLSGLSGEPVRELYDAFAGDKKESTCYGNNRYILNLRSGKEMKDEVKNMENNLDKIRKAGLETMDVVFSICQKLNLRCYLAYGTLIGAVRHHGFIPWDDDIDLVMPRPDYEMFLRKAPQFLPTHMKLNHYSLSDADNTFVTLKVENTKCNLLRTYKGNIEKWVNSWVDIWPTDGVPEGKLAFDLFKIKTLILLCLIRLCEMEIVGVSSKKRGIVERLIIEINKKLHLGKLMNRKKLYQKMENHLRKLSYDSCKHTVMILGEERFEATVPISYYGNPVMLDFLGKQYPAPTEYDKLLRVIFGDYMKLPPENERAPRHIVVRDELSDESEQRLNSRAETDNHDNTIFS